MAFDTVENKTEPKLVASFVKIKNEPENYENDIQSELLGVKMELKISDRPSFKEESYDDDDANTDSNTWHKPYMDSIDTTVNCKEEPAGTLIFETEQYEVATIPLETERNSSTSCDNDVCNDKKIANKLDLNPSDTEKQHLGKENVKDEELSFASKEIIPTSQRGRPSKIGQNAQHSDHVVTSQVAANEFAHIVPRRKHRRLENNRFKCDQCDVKCETASKLKQHKSVHMTENPFSCEVCHRRFPERRNLLMHQGKSCLKWPAEKPIVCEICNKEFKKIFLLQSHLKKHTTERPYTCDICKMNFKYKSALASHFRVHDGNKPYSCNICKKNFSYAGLIKPHMRVHTGERPYSCPICNKLFSIKHNMLRHVVRHEKVKRLVCDICNKKFPKESHLRYHIRTHTKEKPFNCGICTKTFSHKSNVMRHYAAKHPDDKYSCPETEASVARTIWDNIISKKIKLEPGAD